MGSVACTTADEEVPKPLETTAVLPSVAPTAIVMQTETLPKLPVIGPAPELQNDVWINTESSLRLADLQGKVVLLEFWTFG